MKKNKKIGLLLATALMIGSLSILQNQVRTYAAEVTQTAGTVTPAGTPEAPAEGNIKTSAVFPGKDNLDPLFTQKVQLKDESLQLQKDVVSNYFKFTLEEDSWVYLGGSLSLNNHDGITVKVKLYSDAAFSKVAGAYEWGYYTSKKDNELTAVLKAGTYYGHIQMNHANYDDFDGNVNIIGAAVPLKDVIKLNYKVNKNKNKAAVTVTTGLGSFFDYAQYRKGKVGTDAVKNLEYWGFVNSFGWIGSGDRKAVQIKLNDGNAAKFTVKNNGYYTVRFTDKYMTDAVNAESKATSYSQFIKIKGIDDKAPAVKGVKSGSAYRTAVKITFSDKDSGIKSAKLNGKSVRSGVTVSLRGSYRLVVKDKAGNTSTINFRIIR